MAWRRSHCPTGARAAQWESAEAGGKKGGGELPEKNVQEKVHWDALTDGRTKYIFHARDGEKQVFDLSQDPRELRDLAADPAHAARLRDWRERLVAHLAERGERFVKNGRLAVRAESYLYSPSFPRTSNGVWNVEYGMSNVGCGGPTRARRSDSVAPAGAVQGGGGAGI